MVPNADFASIKLGTVPTNGGPTNSRTPDEESLLGTPSGYNCAKRSLNLSVNVFLTRDAISFLSYSVLASLYSNGAYFSPFALASSMISLLIYLKNVFKNNFGKML